MYSKLKKAFALTLSICLVSSLFTMDASANEIYKNTNRDTLLSEEAITIKKSDVSEYDKLYETDEAVFYFRDDRDIIAVFDKETGYLWKTGLDAGYAKSLKSKALRASSESDFEYFENNPIEGNMNEIYTDFANSLISVEYRDPEKIENLKRISSASKDSESALKKISDSEYVFEVKFTEIDLSLKAYISFEGKKIHYSIPFEEMEGEGVNALNDLFITPFLGSSGGQILAFNRETKSYDIETKKDAPSGYAFVPDGSGALIRFNDNSVSFQKYSGDVYGTDISQTEYYYRKLTDAVDFKNTLMPVFGVAYGNDHQVGFVAYADKGAEYMSVECTPEENTTYYTWTSAVFTYNLRYHQVYNKAGDGYFTTLSTPNKFDIGITYEFLSGDYANYVGMARAYRNHLLETGVLTENDAACEDIPLRLDFAMSDAKSSVVGRTNVVMTTVSDVREILDNVNAGGVNNIVSSLSGWQKNGVTFSKPYTSKFTSKIGTKNEFASLIKDFSEKNVDISLSQDYVTINKDMVAYSMNAVRHVNSWYALVDKEDLLPVSAPVTSFGFAKPEKSAEWFLTQFNKQKEYTSSMTVKGIGSILTGDYSSKEPVSVEDTILLYQDTFDKVGDLVKLNFDSPSMYLWKYTDRFFNAPVGHSQYIFETDAVPFLQIVLNGTMELFAPYANFSFYGDEDILKMIDYNLSPSFVLTKKPSYLLADTVSADLYSTEYSLYEDLILEVYGKVNSVLSEVSGYEWVGRSVLEDGVIKNIYSKNGAYKYVYINYTENEVTYDQVTINPVSAIVLSE